MIDIPNFLSHLERYGEYPVPYIVKYVNGKPDFRVVDMEKWDRCVRFHLCSICGDHLETACFIVGGPLTGNSYLFFDPPMHKRCAEYSAAVCPYVSGKDRTFSSREVKTPHTSLDHIQPRNVDGELFLYKIRTFRVKVVEVNGARLLKAHSILGKTLITKS